MAVDLVFRGGPLSFYATVGSTGSGVVQLHFKDTIHLMSSYIPAPTAISLLDGRLEFRVSAESNQLFPSGKGWVPSTTTGQLFPRIKVRRR